MTSVHATMLAGLLMAAITACAAQTNTLAGKLMMGYQGWFACAGDGSPVNGWVHWFRNNTPTAPNLTVEMWPDMRELDADELFATSLTYSNGAPAKLYSAYTQKTVLRHFKWMQDYNLDGVFFQRFMTDLGGAVGGLRNQVASNVMVGAETHGRTVAIMYDISGYAVATLFSTLTNDWTYLCAVQGVTNSPVYLRHKGKPVVAIWGFGFAGRPDTPALCTQTINWFKSAGCTVMGGVPMYWRTLGPDAQTNPGWTNAFRAFDVISPWSVGRYADNNGTDALRITVTVPDLADCSSNNIDYLPVIWPGFSWKNLNSGPPNQIPRNGGNFYWRQAYNAVRSGCTMIYGAMFDEVDEATAMFKIAPTPADQPPNCNFVPLNVDGYALPSDWYLQLANQAGRMLRGEIPLTNGIPITPSVGPPVQSVAFVQQPGTVPQGAIIAPEIQVSATGTNSLPAANATVTMALGSGSGALAGSLARLTDTNGIAHFNDLSLNQPGAKTLTATAGSAGATSTPFTVIGPIAALAFTTQPGAAVAGLPFGQQPVIQSVDAAGSPSTNSLPASVAVHITLTNGAGNLSGTTTYDIGTGAGNGTITCSNLAIDAVGNGNQLLASTAPASVVTNPVAGAVLWLDASDAATLTMSGIRVQAWNNKGSGGTTGANLWFTQSTATLQPWRTNYIGSKPVLTFTKNGSGYGTGCTYLGNIGLNSYTNGGNQMTYFAVLRQRNNTFGWQGPVSFSTTGQTDGQGTAGVVVLADGSQTAPYPLGIQRNHPATPMQANVAVPPLLTPFVLSFVDNAGAATLRILEAGGAVRNNSANIVNGISPYKYNITDVTIGGRLEPSPGTIDNGWEGDVAEVLVYNSALSATESAAVETYLSNKWFVAAAGETLASALSTPFSVVPEPAAVLVLPGIFAAVRAVLRRRCTQPLKRLTNAPYFAIL
jgi:hypothetical protein